MQVWLKASGKGDLENTRPWGRCRQVHTTFFTISFGLPVLIINSDMLVLDNSMLFDIAFVIINDRPLFAIPVLQI